MTNMDKTCCILIGSTGCGKSTIIENMCINDGTIKIGNSSNSGTKSISVVKHKSTSNLLLMDTVGCEDTDNKMTDDEILKEITHNLAENGAPKIKVIWCTKPEDKKTPKLQKQAKFINSLVNGNWSAVQIIIKKGTEKADANGPKSAAKKYTQGELSTFDLHCLDRIENYKEHKFYKYAHKGPLEERLSDGMVYSTEINGVILEQIHSLKSATAELTKEFYHDKNCQLTSKMIHRGRIITSYSHTGYVKLKYGHYGSIQKYPLSGHTSSCESSKTSIRKHRGYPKTIYKHQQPLDIKYKHVGDDIKETYEHKGSPQPTWRHKSTRINQTWTHRGSVTAYHSYSTTECPNGHSESELRYLKYKSGSWVSYWRCYRCNANIRVGDNFYHCYSCCDRGGRDGHSSIVKKCSGMFCTSCGRQTTHHYDYKYSGCGCSSGSSPYKCTEVLKWDVCGCDKYSGGCVSETKWSDCGCLKNDKATKNCKVIRRYLNCRCFEGQSGCRREAKWRCGCEENSRGCQSETKWTECGHLRNSPGCDHAGYKYSCGKDSCKYEEKYTGCKCLKGSDPTTNCRIIEEKWSCCNKQKNDNECQSNKGNDVSYYSECKHKTDDANYCHKDYKYHSVCKIKEGQKLKQMCGKGHWKYVPKNFC